MKNSKDKSLVFSFIGTLTLLVIIIGITYAILQVRISVDDVIVGKTAKFGVDIAVSKILPEKTTTSTETNLPIGLIPQDSTKMNRAIKKGCIYDKNTTCEVYTIAIENNGDASVIVNGKISFTTDIEGSSIEEKMPNLKWSIANEQNGIITVTEKKSAISETQELENDVTLQNNGENKIHRLKLIVWLEDTGEIQFDEGKYIATISYEAEDSNGNIINGVTSTITE